MIIILCFLSSEFVSRIGSICTAIYHSKLFSFSLRNKSAVLVGRGSHRDKTILGDEAVPPKRE